jgi:hypothetical protein
MFVKYGDGEYNAANFYQGGNCDGTPYTKNLGEKLIESFIYNSQQSNSMLGKWHMDSSLGPFWESLVNVKINWVDFTTILFDSGKQHESYLDRVNFYRAIKESEFKKIYVANSKMYKAKELLKLDHHIIIDSSNWFDTEYSSVFNSIKTTVGDNGDKTIILVSGGMGSKYLVSELHKLYPTAIYIDIGSSLDYICTKNKTRAHSMSYGDICAHFKDLLPEGWD